MPTIPTGHETKSEALALNGELLAAVPDWQTALSEDATLSEVYAENAALHAHLEREHEAQQPEEEMASPELLAEIEEWTLKLAAVRAQQAELDIQIAADAEAIEKIKAETTAANAKATALQAEIKSMDLEIARQVAEIHRLETIEIPRAKAQLEAALERHKTYEVRVNSRAQQILASVGQYIPTNLPKAK